MQAAFEVLNDKSKRDLYDRYGGAYENVRAGGGQAGPNPWADVGQGGPQGFDINLEDLFGGGTPAGGGGGFADLFKNFKQRNRKAPPARGANIEHALTVPFATAVLGGEAEINLRRKDGKTEAIRVKIPAGIESGKKIRLRGKGDPSSNGGPPGDILIRIDVATHPHFRRQGSRLDVRVPVTLAEALGGAKIDVPSPNGTITLTIPPGSSSGSRFRLKGQGVKSPNGESGDLYAEIQITLPDNMSDEQRAQILDLLGSDSTNPRANLLW